jgi:hypothetical protein
MKIRKLSRSISAVLAATLCLAVCAQAVDKDSVLRSFIKGQGWSPAGTLLMDSADNLYGGAVAGGPQ